MQSSNAEAQIEPTNKKFMKKSPFNFLVTGNPGWCTQGHEEGKAGVNYDERNLEEN